MLFSHSATLLDPTAFSQPFLIHLCYPIHISFYKFCFWDYNLITSLLSSFSFLWNPPISLHLTFCFLNSGTLVSMYLWNTMWQRWAVPLSSLLPERLWEFQLYLHSCCFRRWKWNPGKWREGDISHVSPVKTKICWSRQCTGAHMKPSRISGAALQLMIQHYVVACSYWIGQAPVFVVTTNAVFRILRVFSTFQNGHIRYQYSLPFFSWKKIKW